jgi:hypothetical protein
MNCFSNNVKIPKNVTQLIINNDNIFLNNLPEEIKKIYIYFYSAEELASNKNKNKNVENLSITLKEIVIQNKKYEKYLTKIPFGTIITIQKNLFY